MKRTMCLPLCLLLMASCVACGPLPSSATPAADTSFAPEAGAALVYWSMWGEEEPQAAVLDAAIDAFTASAGVPVTVHFSARQTRDSLIPALESGQQVDLFDEDIDYLRGHWADELLALDRYYNAATEGVPLRGQLAKPLVALAQQLGEGNLVCVPYQPFVQAVLYNKALFAAAGVSAAPQSWQDFLAVCAQLKSGGITPLTADDTGFGTLLGYSLCRLAGSEAAAKMVADKHFSGTALQKAAEAWAATVQQGFWHAGAGTNIWPEGQTQFAGGGAAMYVGGSWLLGQLAGQGSGQWGAFPFPTMGKAEGHEATMYGSSAFGISRQSRYPNAAFALVRWLCTGAQDAKLAKGTGGIPCLAATPWPAPLAEVQPLFEATTVRIRPAAGIDDDYALHTAVKQAFQQLVQRQITAAEFCSQIRGTG